MWPVVDDRMEEGTGDGETLSTDLEQRNLGVMGQRGRGGEGGRGESKAVKAKKKRPSKTHEILLKITEDAKPFRLLC